MQNTCALSLWLLWLLGASCFLWRAQAAEHRAVLSETTLYCNITSDCKPCLPKHIDSEACRPTAYTEHMLCSTNSNTQHEVTLNLHRRVSPKAPSAVHVSRSCKAPDSSGSQDSSSTEAAITEHPPDGVSENNNSSTAAAGAADADGAANAVHRSRVTYPLYVSGGVNLLYFELAMLVVLSGALPVVYIRKRRVARL